MRIRYPVALKIPADRIFFRSYINASINEADALELYLNVGRPAGVGWSVAGCFIDQHGIPAELADSFDYNTHSFPTWETESGILWHFELPN